MITTNVLSEPVEKSTDVPCGYEEDFVNPVDDDLQCSICQSALRNPVLTRCGHRFCRGCLERHMSNRYVFDELNVKKLCIISQCLRNKENISFLLDNRIQWCSPKQKADLDSVLFVIYNYWDNNRFNGAALLTRLVLYELVLVVSNGKWSAASKAWHFK